MMLSKGVLRRRTRTAASVQTHTVVSSPAGLPAGSRPRMPAYAGMPAAYAGMPAQSAQFPLFSPTWAELHATQARLAVVNTQDPNRSRGVQRAWRGGAEPWSLCSETRTFQPSLMKLEVELCHARRQLRTSAGACGGIHPLLATRERQAPSAAWAARRAKNMTADATDRNKLRSAMELNAHVGVTSATTQ
jgi:hypothetical protein